ncbi:MAG: hypothetical protein NWR72_15490, partial [Bacteroidia bacterium]|nr:hypothetical protein [Bacteroidia bacterium]
AQTKSINFQLSLNGQPLELGKNYFLPSIQDSIQVDAFRIYLSDVTFFRGNEKLGTANKQHILLDAETPSSLKLEVSAVERADRVRFQVGIDSVTNMAGAMGGDLDPTNGMYWTWQSGYINLKLEGSSPSCPARKNQFQYHIGGYQAPNKTSQQVELSLESGDNLVIDIAMERFLEQVDIRQTYQVMSPNAQAVALSRLIPSMFSIHR